ncbi:MAG: OmpH family outer membrane protein [Flavobacteriales bacterium]|nr:OmpH family outer membrane protein [Flavobacteriales bacterium]
MNKYLIGVLVMLLAYVIYDRTTQPKYAYIDIEMVFNEFNLQKELSLKFDAFKNSAQNEMDSLEAIAQSIYARIQQDPSDQLKKDFNYSREVYLKTKAEKEQKIEELTEQYDQQIINQINQYVEDFGKENNYTMILGTNGNGTVMYSDSSKNITKKVIQYLNNKYDGIVE